MAQFQFKLPDVGEGIAEAEIVAWHVKPGDEIREDQPLVDVMTDKATVEIPSPASGRVVSLTGELGAQAAVGSVIAIFEVEGAGNAPAAAPAPSPAAAAPAPEPAKAPEPAPPAPVAREPAGGGSPAQRSGAAPAAARVHDGRRPLASPAVRHRALEAGVRLEFVTGTGPAGRITHQDLDAYIAAPSGAPGGRGFARRADVETVKVIGLRRAIATRMADSKRRIPHFAYIEEVDVTDLERLRAQLNAQHKDKPRLTVLPFIARALVRALPHWPQINARFDDEAGEVHRIGAVHLGIATQTPGGLVVPVVKHAESLDLWETAAEISRLAEAARSGKASREELSGSTITITSLGPLGGLSTTPVINAPEVAIVGPNRIIERPMVVDGAVVIRKMMNLSSSFDHRVVDGWDAAEFIQRVKALLETPALMFVETP